VVGCGDTKRPRHYVLCVCVCHKFSTVSALLHLLYKVKVNAQSAITLRIFTSMSTVREASIAAPERERERQGGGEGEGGGGGGGERNGHTGTVTNR